MGDPKCHQVCFHFPEPFRTLTPSQRSPESYLEDFCWAGFLGPGSL